MKHGGEEAAAHENGAPSSKWWAQLSAEQKAFVFSMQNRNLEGMKEAVEPIRDSRLATSVH